MVSFLGKYSNDFSLENNSNIIPLNNKFNNDKIFAKNFYKNFYFDLQNLLNSALTNEDKLLCIDSIESIYELIFTFDISQSFNGNTIISNKTFSRFFLFMILDSLILDKYNNNNIYLDFHKKLSKKYKDFIIDFSPK